MTLMRWTETSYELSLTKTVNDIHGRRAYTIPLTMSMLIIYLCWLAHWRLVGLRSAALMTLVEIGQFANMVFAVLGIVGRSIVWRVMS